uniref:Uncharacterized protein n=1 Tax=Arundo donax TaxID=35708 RepID=A0A0A8ZI44_ARUDO
MRGKEKCLYSYSANQVLKSV